jgi:hypothetical protein
VKTVQSRLRGVSAIIPLTFAIFASFHLAAAQSNSTAISKKELIEELAAIYKENPAVSAMGSQQSASFRRREPLPTLCSIRSRSGRTGGRLGKPFTK